MYQTLDYKNIELRHRQKFWQLLNATSVHACKNITMFTFTTWASEIGNICLLVVSQ